MSYTFTPHGYLVYEQRGDIKPVERVDLDFADDGSVEVYVGGARVGGVIEVRTELDSSGGLDDFTVTLKLWVKDVVQRGEPQEDWES